MQVLPDRAVISIDGVKAADFLQGLVTCDVAALNIGQASYGALLSPQGKIFADFFMVKTADGFLIDCAAAQVNQLLAKLNLYKLHLKLNIMVQDALEVGAGPASNESLHCFPDPRLPAMGFRLIAPKGTLPHSAGYDTWRIAHGVADSTADIGSEKLFPHEANFDLLNGVSFSKGCYVGQEVVSRMQHKGITRSRIVMAAYEGAVPPPGSEVRAGTHPPLGFALSATDKTGLAFIRLDRWTETQQPILAAGIPTRLLLPNWMADHVTFNGFKP